MKWEIGKGKGMRKGKSLDSEMRGTGGRPPRHQGKGKGGGLAEQRWWGDWRAMKEGSAEDLEKRRFGERD